MARRRRIDFPGAWHHVTNRGVSSRPIFEREQDVRYFLSRVARAVRRGEIEIVAFCVLGTHFHLFVRSVEGSLAAAMRQIQGQYAQRFNRSRLRDGGLYKGRYYSSLVDSGVYRDNLIRYIDANAVKAGIVTLPQWYPACSAYWYSRPRRPPWLARSWVEAWVSNRLEGACFHPAMYARVYRPRLSRSLREWIEARLNTGEPAPESIDDLAAATPSIVREWLERNAITADGPVGARPRVPIVPVIAVEAVLRRVHVWSGTLPVSPERPEQERAVPLCSRPLIARAGLLRGLAGLSHREIAARLRCSESTASHRAMRHRELLASDPSYASEVADIVNRISRYIY